MRGRESRHLAISLIQIGANGEVQPLGNWIVAIDSQSFSDGMKTGVEVRPLSVTDHPLFVTVGIDEFLALYNRSIYRLLW